MAQNTSGKIYFYFLDFSKGVLRPLRGSKGIRMVAADLLVACEKSNRVLQKEVLIGSKRAWVVVLQESMLQRFGLLAMQFADAKLEKTKPLKAALWIGLLLSIIVSFIAGKVLSSFLLVPINDLMVGMKAIRLRQTDVKIPKRREDEFGELVTLFNKMLTELKELELAKLVQNALFPPAVPNISGYSIAVKSVSAADLGGDYYDLIPLNSGNLLVLLGDVTGHGVSAALAMAMAKAGVAYSIAVGEFSPNAILDNLNGIFFSQLKSQRKFMTVLLGILDPIEHKMDLYNSGHNYPMLLQAESGKFMEPALQSSPIGFRKQIFPAKAQMHLRKNDLFVFFTDGFTEAMKPTGDFIGSEGLKKAIRNAVESFDSAPEIVQSLFDFFYHEKKEGPQDDDVTIVVIKRL